MILTVDLRRSRRFLLINRRRSVGQEQRERASLALGALKFNFSAEQARKLTANRQSQAGSSVTTACAAFGLLESLKNHALLLRRNSDSAIANREGQNAV